uniref:Uncharacterized protein n=1 Tax=Oryza rufipogon TaxID=4529 RepID=A0A0E0PMP0_ORYRU
MGGGGGGAGDRGAARSQTGRGGCRLGAPAQHLPGRPAAERRVAGSSDWRRRTAAGGCGLLGG